MVSKGENSVGIYYGNEVTRLPIKSLGGTTVNIEYQVTNSVSATDDFILMANGDAGIGIIKLNDNLQISEESVLEVSGSSNYVKADGDYIFTASGADDLRILKTSKTSDLQLVPDFLNCSAATPHNTGPSLNINSNEENSIAELPLLTILM